MALLFGWQKWKSPERETVVPLVPIKDDTLANIPAPSVIGLAVSGERREIKPSETPDCVKTPFRTVVTENIVHKWIVRM